MQLFLFYDTNEIDLNPVSRKGSHCITPTVDRLAQLVEHRTAVREIAGSNLDRTNTQGLSITDDKVLPFVMTSANG